MRRIEEPVEVLRLPVIAPGFFQRLVHALLDHAPSPLDAHEEGVQIQIESVLHGGCVDLGHQAARGREGLGVDSRAVADRGELRGRPPRFEPFATAHIDAQLALDRREPPLQCPDYARGDSRGMPIHSHHRAEGLKPEGMREPAQELRSPVFEHDGFDDDPAELRHAPGEPRGYVTGMQGETGTARTLRHAIRAALPYIERRRAERCLARCSARSISLETSARGVSPDSAQSLGYIEMAVNPGRVLISFTKSSPCAVRNKSTRARPSHSKISKVFRAMACASACTSGAIRAGNASSTPLSSMYFAS